MTCAVGPALFALRPGGKNPPDMARGRAGGHIPPEEADRLARNVGPQVTTGTRAGVCAGGPAVAVRVERRVPSTTRASRRARARRPRPHSPHGIRIRPVSGRRPPLGHRRARSEALDGAVEHRGRIQPAEPRTRLVRPAGRRRAHPRTSGGGTRDGALGRFRHEAVDQAIRHGRRGIADAIPRVARVMRVGARYLSRSVYPQRSAWSSHPLQPGRWADPAGCWAVDRRPAVSGIRRRLSRFCLPRPSGRQ